MLILEELSPRNTSKHATFVHSLSNYTVMNFYMLTVAGRDIAVGFFAGSSNISQSNLGRNLLGHSLEDCGIVNGPDQQTAKASPFRVSHTS